MDGNNLKKKDCRDNSADNASKKVFYHSLVENCIFISKEKEVVQTGKITLKKDIWSPTEGPTIERPVTFDQLTCDQFTGDQPFQ
jgi:hypothetical protein